MTNTQQWRWALIFARYALAWAFISAVADRFGWWGDLGQLGVTWGDMGHFYADTAGLTPWLPLSLVPLVAWAVTLLELALGVCLILGLQLRLSAALSGIILLAFAVSMASFLSLKLALNFSVLSCSACAFLVYLASDGGRPA